MVDNPSIPTNIDTAMDIQMTENSKESITLRESRNDQIDKVLLGSYSANIEVDQKNVSIVKPIFPQSATYNKNE